MRMVSAVEMPVKMETLRIEFMDGTGHRWNLKRWSLSKKFMCLSWRSKSMSSGIIWAFIMAARSWPKIQWAWTGAAIWPMRGSICRRSPGGILQVAQIVEKYAASWGWRCRKPLQSGSWTATTATPSRESLEEARGRSLHPQGHGIKWCPAECRRVGHCPVIDRRTSSGCTYWK